ncbi:MAG TPA: serine protease [Candidatus Hydrogenedentes bacterium]|nr:serine protease [Candidatus Hydrogenedentota bacterium]HOL76469.1 serine protease [Candidatus Hydrogenedentota bacterium]HPO85133.1 serine protease [Candidatus Hydrogenedentota bacterium]
MSSHLQEIKKSVSFIFIPDNTDRLKPNGTGFFVGVKHEYDEKFSVYFVTAKHVLQDKNGKYLPEVVLRLNKKEGDSQLIKIALKDVKIFEHPNKDVDIALFNCLPDQNLYDFKFIPDNLIANKEIIAKNEISEGDEVFFAGLFTSHVGQKRNQPIIRFGRVALISDEKIEWKEKDKPPKFMDLLLLECQSFGGNSGSPVFFQLNPLRKPGQIILGGPVIFLAGIMTGSFLQGSQIQITDMVSNLIALQNVGIAAVTPADKLHEILFSEEMVKLRRGIQNNVPLSEAQPPNPAGRD